MIIVLIVVGIICIIFSRYIWKKGINPLSFSVSYIIITHLLAFFRVFDMIQVNNQVYFLSLLGLIGLFIGATLSFFPQHIHIKTRDNEETTKLNNRIILVLVIVVTSIYLLAFLNIASFFLSGMNWDVLRNMYFRIGNSDTTLLSGTLQFLIEYIANPLLHILIPIACITLFSSELTNCKKKYIPIIFLNCVLQMVITGGGRMILVELIFHIIITILLLKGIKVVEDGKIRFRGKWIVGMLFLSSILVGIIYFASVNRGKGVFTPILTLYNYFVGGLANTSIKLEAPYLNKPLFGQLSFFGFWNLFSQMGELVGYTDKNVQIIVNYMRYLNIPLSIGSSVRFNSFITMFYMFYVDGGYIAVVLFSVIVGYICQRAYMSYRKRGDEKRLVILLILFSSLLYINIRSPFYQRYIAMSILYWYILYRLNMTDKV